MPVEGSVLPSSPSCESVRLACAHRSAPIGGLSLFQKKERDTSSKGQADQPNSGLNYKTCKCLTRPEVLVLARTYR